MRKITSYFVLISFILSCILPSQGFAQTLNAVGLMPQPGTPVALTQAFTPAHLRGMVIYPNDPFKFDFIVFRGDEKLTDDQKQNEYPKLIKYFLAALAIPDEDQWVNLSPYENDRIIPDNYGLTEMGRDVLAQDYMLKQISASLTNPDTDLGRKFWDAVYEMAYQKFGTTEIPTDTFNKVWIVPDKAVIFEKGDTVVVLEHHLKVMLESDYRAMKENGAGADTSAGESEVVKLSKTVMREVIIPAIEKEVNEGKNFAPLRQIHNSMLLAAWYKRALKESILNKVYGDRAKVKGIDQDPQANQEIYNQYVVAFKKGVFNMIKEDVDRFSQEVIPRKYFSGGDLAMGLAIVQNPAILQHAPDSLETNSAAAEVAQNSDRVTAALTTRETAANPVTVPGLNPVAMAAKVESAPHIVVRGGSVALEDIDYESLLKQQEKLFSQNDFESAVLRDLADAARSYYMQDGPDGERVWKKSENNSNDGEFIKQGQGLKEALKRNGFYQSPFFYALVKKLLKYQFGDKPEDVSTEEGMQIASKWAQTGLVEKILEKYRDGKLPVAEFQVSLAKRFIAKNFKFFASSVGTNLIAYGVFPASVAVLTHYGAHEWQVPLAGAFKYNALEALLAMGFSPVLLSKLASKLDEMGEKSVGELYEEVFINHVRNKTAEEIANDFKTFRSSFSRARAYVKESGGSFYRRFIYQRALKQLESIVLRGLPWRERFFRAGENVADIMDLADSKALTASHQMSEEALFILMLDELRSENPGYLDGLEKKWTQLAKGYAAIGFKNTPAHIFLQALKYVRENMDDTNFYRDLAKKEGVQGEDALNLEARKLLEARQSDVPFYQYLLEKLSSAPVEERELMAIILAYRTYSRLHQIGDHFLQRGAKEAYRQRVLENADYLARNLENLLGEGTIAVLKEEIKRVRADAKSETVGQQAATQVSEADAVAIDAAMHVTGLSDVELPRIIEMEIVRNFLLKNPGRYEEFARNQNNAYAIAHGYPASDKPLSEKEIYRNMAGVFATLEGAALIAERDGRKLREVAREIMDGTLNDFDKTLMVRMAHATWLSTQFDDNYSTKRFTRPIVMPAQELTPKSVKDDFDQIRAAANTLHGVVSEVVEEQLDTKSIEELQGRAEDLIGLVKTKTALTEQDEERIRKTALTVFYAHREQKRKQGTPYAEHPVGVAELAFKLFGDTRPFRNNPALFAVSALLHDTREDQPEFFEQFRNFARNVIQHDTTEAGKEKLDKFNSVLLAVRILSKLEQGGKYEGSSDDLLAKYYEIMVDPRVTYNREGMPSYDDDFIRAVQILKLCDILYNSADLSNLFEIAKTPEDIQSAGEKANKAFRKIFEFAMPILIMKSQHLQNSDVNIFFAELEKTLRAYAEKTGEQFAPLAQAASEAIKKLEAVKAEYSQKPAAVIQDGGVDAAAANGGIDFAQSNLEMQIKRDGTGVPLPISQQNLDNIRIDGLVPVILNIQPAANVPLFSEAGTSPPKEG